MNKFLAGLAVSITMASTSAYANMEICKTLGESAEVTMKARQVGVAMSQALASIPANLNGDGRRLLENIVVEAYKVPRFSTAEMQYRATQDYRNRIELACFTTMSR